jgi:hypothetical protein
MRRRDELVKRFRCKRTTNFLPIFSSPPSDGTRLGFSEPLFFLLQLLYFDFGPKVTSFDWIKFGNYTFYINQLTIIIIIILHYTVTVLTFVLACNEIINKRLLLYAPEVFQGKICTFE